jgi:hypothetical protein
VCSHARWVRVVACYTSARQRGRAAQVAPTLE